MKRFLGVVFLLAVATPTRVLASAMSPEPMPMPSPGVTVMGHANVHVEELEIACATDTAMETTASCDVHARLSIDAVEPLVIAPQPDTFAGQITVEGDALTAPLEVAAGRVVVSEIRFHASLSSVTRHDDEPWLVVPIRVRHFYLGESGSMRRAGDGTFGVLVDGPDIHFVGATHVVARRGAMSVRFGGESVDEEAIVTPAHAGLELALIVPERASSVVQNGGPVLGLGARFSLDHEDDGRFFLRVAYELGLADYVVGSLSFETDFESILESAVIELASPELIVLFPSVSVGVGAVARQLGNRDADAALRLRIGGNLFCAGFAVDFDYWPVIGEWTGTVVGRLSF